MGKILVTGGTGFIGSHACVSLINAGYSVVVVDNLCNSKVEALARIQLITGKQVRFYQADLRDAAAIVIGSEGFGMSRLVEEQCDVKVRIPMHGHITSLNASAAAAIMLYEAVRQRKK